MKAMKNIGTIVLAAVGFVATAAQALFAWGWTRGDVTKQFASVFQGIYGELPSWTAFMFGLGMLVWLLPAISAVILILALRRKAQLPLSVASALAVALLVAMIYAMYPIHIMMLTA
jgi:hypothetical protein